MTLSEMTSKPIQAGTTPLSRKESDALHPQISDWSLGEGELGREFRFKDFRQAMDFVNRVAAVADGQDHHPDILISYNQVRLTLSTHKIGGLSMNDFIVAAKIDQLAGQQRSEKAA